MIQVTVVTSGHDYGERGAVPESQWIEVDDGTGNGFMIHASGRDGSGSRADNLAAAAEHLERIAGKIRKKVAEFERTEKGAA